MVWTFLSDWRIQSLYHCESCSISIFRFFVAFFRDCTTQVPSPKSQVHLQLATRSQSRPTLPLPYCIHCFATLLESAPIRYSSIDICSPQLWTSTPKRKYVRGCSSLQHPHHGGFGLRWPLPGQRIAGRPCEAFLRARMHVSTRRGRIAEQQ